MWGTLKSGCSVALTAVVLAGCGGAGAGGEGDPATVTPPGALLYLEVVVRPEGALRDDALAAASKVLATDDPEARIQELVEQALAEDRGEEIDYERDLEPWLGERAAIWTGVPDDSYSPTVVLLSATDTDEARTSLEAMLERGGHETTERSHRGSDYLVDSSDVAAGIVGDFVAIGPEAQYRRTVDAAEGDSLAEADEYADAVDGLEEERLAQLWADTPALVERARPDVAQLVPLEGVQPIVASFAADGDRLAAEVQLRAEGLGRLLAGGSTPLLQELPGDSWAAFGAADVGVAVGDTIDGYAGPIGAIVAQREVQRRLGLDLERDLLSWIGHVAFFVRGTTPQTLDGGLVIQPTDEDRAADAFGRIVGALQVKARVKARPVDVAGADQAFELGLRGFARPIVLARGSGLVVATAGRAAAEAALAAGDRLGDTDLYAQAEELVGMEPGLLLSMPELIALSDPEPEKEPSLEAFSLIAGGSTGGDDEATGRIVAGLE